MEELLEQLDPNHENNIQEDEFMLIMKYIQQKRPSSLPPLNPADKSILSSATGSSNTFDADRKKYGALLPKVGVYFLPDDKVIGFLK